MKLTRVTMNLSNRSLNNVEELSKIINAENRTRVVSSALEISKNILQRIENGQRIFVRDKHGIEYELHFVY